MLKVKGFGPILLFPAVHEHVCFSMEILENIVYKSTFLVNTGDLLQAAINDEWIRGELNLPTDNDFGQKYPIVQYMDDTLMIMPINAQQLMYLKEILAMFSASTGLKVNYNKTSLIPINISEDH
jgi:hypothetical protein